MSTPARRLPQSFEGHVPWLKDVRSEGNKLFTERNWAAAESKYSDCINSAGAQLDINGLHDTAMQEKYNRIVMLANSNRAEANLRLLKYEDALQDADRALQIDSKQTKTLVRKGRVTAMLSDQLDRTSFKRTQSKDFRAQMLSVYQKVFGKQPDTVLYNLMQKSIAA